MNAPRPTEQEKEKWCSKESPEDREACKLEYDLNYDYQIAVHEGRFSGTYNDYKKKIGKGIITWTHTSTTEKKPNDKDKEKNIAKYIAIGLVVLVVGVIIYKTVRK